MNNNRWNDRYNRQSKWNNDRNDWDQNSSGENWNYENNNRGRNYGSAYHGSSYGTRSGEEYGRNNDRYSNRGDFGNSRSDYGYGNTYNQGSQNYNSGLGYGNTRGSGYRGEGHYDNQWEDRKSYGQQDDFNRNRNYGREYETNDWNRNSNERNFFDKAGDEISSWFGDDEARRRREQDQKESDSYNRSGDRSWMKENRGKGPRNYQRSDSRIKEDVNDRLSDDWGIDASEIDVEVTNGEVILSGTVDNRNAKRRAEDIVESISGVKNVENRIKISDNSSFANTNTGYRSGTETNSLSNTVNSTKKATV